MTNHPNRSKRPQTKVEAWARLPIINLNLATYPVKNGQIGGRPTYLDPVTEIARAAWYAGIASADIDKAV